MTSPTDIRDLLATIYASFSSGDGSAWESALGAEVMLTGTDEAEWWQGADVLPVLRAQLTEMSGAGIRVTGGDAPVIGAAGDVVWAADRPTLHLPDGTTATLRATVVASRAGGTLELQQMHLSAPAPNEDLVQQELTV